MEDAIPSCDVLVTTSPHTTLVMMVADCVPIALVDPSAGVLAVVHAGWRGTAASAAVKGVEAILSLGGDLCRVIAFIGPAVDQDRYQVDRTVLEGLQHAVAPDPLAATVVRADGQSHWLVDLVEANRQQLRLAGLAADHIFTSGTSTADEQYFSDRAQRPCGRFALMARLVG
jgi:YfiH family protein